MSAFLYLVTALMGGHVTVVAYDQPTGNLEHGDVLIETRVPSRAICDDRGGRYIVGYCVDEDF